MYKNIFLLVITLTTIVGCKTEKVKVFTEADIHVIPKPQEVSIGEGSFMFNENTRFHVSNDDQLQASEILIQKFRTVAKWDLGFVKVLPKSNYISYKTNETLEDESYTIHVETKGVTIEANSYSGFLYAVETIRQLLPTEIESKVYVEASTWEIPNVKITDSPRFKWRGLMLDVSRHFFDKEYIKEIIDGLAMHKMNVLHLHLVDDQGWRIEIKKYPKLTEVGAYRVDQEDASWQARDVNKPTDKATFGGFYSQKDIKEIVQYATSKGIEVIPEIEMPAHVMSAVASYPELSCFETPIGVPSGGVWPITEIYCAGKESTFEFLENVLLEVMDIFPSKYIHIGGDEATKTNWAKCPHCKARMKTEGLHDVEELQSYFIKRMEKFINSKGRKLIGWDEILEGGLAPDATVMSWRGVKGGVEAAKQGHDVVMTPGSHCYFDHYQGPRDEEPLAWGGFTPLSKVYQFDPIVDSMTEQEASHVLGGQANLWSEYVPTDEQSEYMIYPRIAALAEAVWSPKASRDWDDFSSRIEVMFNRYEMQGINYAKSAYLVTADTQINIEKKTVELLLKNEFSNSDIRYVLGEEKLSANAKKYEKPIQLTETKTVRASIFKNDKPFGKEFYKTIKFHKAVGKKVTYTEPSNERYKGAGEFNMVNTLRGTKNFHDGQWQAWLGKDMEVIIDLETITKVSTVTVGSLENQGPGIYFPTAITVEISNDGKIFNKVGEIKRAYAKNGDSELKDFIVNFKEKDARFIKVKATCFKNLPKGGGVYLFIDEIVIE